MTVDLGHVDEMGDGMNHVVEVLIDLMLPKPKDDPSLLDVVSCDVGIPFDVTSNLLSPELGVRLRDFKVKGAAMPIAGVQKDDDTESGKRDVWCPIQLPIVLPISISGSPKCFSDLHFHFGILATIPAHRLEDGWTRCFRYISGHTFTSL